MTVYLRGKSTVNFVVKFWTIFNMLETEWKVLWLFNPFPNKPRFLRVCNTSLLKTLWEKEKMLVTSNFSFSHGVFYPFSELPAIFIKLKLSSADSFSLEDF